MENIDAIKCFDHGHGVREKPEIFAFKKLESENLDQLNQLKDYPKLTEY